MEIAFLVIATLFVGFSCGCTSVGGVLLVPVLEALTDLDLRMAMGTVLVAFFFSGIAGTVIHHKAGRLACPATLPLCLGSIPLGFAGAVAKEFISIPALSAILGIGIIIGGITALKPVSGVSGMEGVSARNRNTALVAIGAGVAFISAMTGASGPVFSVPIMLLLGYPPVTAIAVAVPMQLAICFSGSVGNLIMDAIDYPMALYTTVLMTVGVSLGTWSLTFFNPNTLKIAVALLCVVTGAIMLGRSVIT